MKMKRHLALFAVCTNLLFATSQANAAEPLELRKIMKELGANMQMATDGISREDWALVENASRQIVEHPQPSPAEQKRIAEFMGSNMEKFEALDEKTHRAAHQMQAAARAKNGRKVIASFQKLQSSCLACHQAFRPAFIAHFYGAPAN